MCFPVSAPPFRFSTHAKKSKNKAALTLSIPAAAKQAVEHECLRARTTVVVSRQKHYHSGYLGIGSRAAILLAAKNWTEGPSVLNNRVCYSTSSGFPRRCTLPLYFQPRSHISLRILLELRFIVSAPEATQLRRFSPADSSVLCDDRSHHRSGWQLATNRQLFPTIRDQQVGIL